MTDGLRRGCAPLDIPVLETDRLILRGLEVADVPAIAALHGDPEVVRYIGGVTDATASGALGKIFYYTGHWAAFGCGKWAVVEKESGRLVGRTGFLDLPYDWPGLELGWTFARDAWGKGYATESARAARDWGFRVLGAERILSMIDPDNTSSQAVARRIGASPWRTHLHDGHTQMLWSITRAAWERLA